MEGAVIRPRDWLTLLVLVVLGAVLSADRGIVSGPTVRFFRTLVVPVENATTSAWDAIADVGGGIVEAPSLRREVAGLREKAAGADATAMRIDELEQENQRLQALLDTEKTLPEAPIAARLIAFYPDSSTGTLSAGSGLGVRAGAPVVSSRGLVGIIVHADAASCQVLFNTSDRFSVGARVERAESRASGIVSGGRGGDRLLFDHVEEGADVAVGDKLVTSGVGTRYPKGLLLGTVMSVWKDPSYGSLRGWVRPAARPDSLEEALILR